MEVRNMDKAVIEQIVRQVLADKFSNGHACKDFSQHTIAGGVTSVVLNTVKVDENNRLDTGKAGDVVYTKDVFTLEESPRLGCGIMEMKETTFDWHLKYDEIDYVIEGTLTIIVNGEKVTAGPGEIILIPKNTKIQFSVPNYARFLYVTYPADWESQ